MKNKAKAKAIKWDGEDSLLIDCYRVRVEFKHDGMRLYFFNPTELGDACIEIKEPVFQAEVWHEKDPMFIFHNKFINPSKRYNKDAERKED